jgi:pimeloyl-ACP methyl ester carboxylesterase
MRAPLLAWTLALLACPALACPALAFESQVATLETRLGVTLKTLFITPAQKPIGGLLLLVGGSGQAWLREGNPQKRGGNFLFRTADNFVQHGFLAALPDLPSDRTDLWNFRSSAQHAADLAAVAQELRRRGAPSVWLVGTSMGTVSAAAAAPLAGPNAKAADYDGVVLTSSIVAKSRMSWEIVTEAPLESIRLPVLVVRHKADSCFASLPGGADSIYQRLQASPRKEILEFEGGLPAKSEPCEAFAPHGFYGVEEETVNAIANWIKSSTP